MKARIRKTPLLDVCFYTFLGVSARKKPVYILKNVPKIGQILEESLPGGKLVKCFKII